MELSSKDYHKELINLIDTDVDQLHETVEDCIRSVKLRISSIKDYSRYLVRYYNLTLADINDITSGSLKRQVDKPISKILYSDEAQLSVLQAALKGLVIVKRVLETSIADIKLITAYRVSYETYKHITVTYNNNIITELLRGCIVYIGNGFGRMRIKMIPGKAASELNTINWKASAKLKKDILAKGGIPYIRKDAKRCKDEGIEYKGEPWCIKADLDDYPYIGWTGKTSTFYKECYKFDPSRTNNTGMDMEELLDSVESFDDIDRLNVGIVKKLSLYLSFNPKQIAKYFRKL